MNLSYFLRVVNLLVGGDNIRQTMVLRQYPVTSYPIPTVVIVQEIKQLALRKSEAEVETGSKAKTTTTTTRAAATRGWLAWLRRSLPQFKGASLRGDNILLVSSVLFYRE